MTKIVSLPNLQIVDFLYGYTGSAHDSTAWMGTYLAKSHRSSLDKGEWVWADLVYLVRLFDVELPNQMESSNTVQFEPWVVPSATYSLAITIPITIFYQGITFSFLVHCS